MQWLGEEVYLTQNLANMEVIFLLIAISLILAGTFLFLFFKAMKSGQFDDDYTPSVRILFENPPKKSTKKNPSTKQKSYE